MLEMYWMQNQPNASKQKSARTNLTNQNKIMNKKYLRTQVPKHKQQHELE